MALRYRWVSTCGYELAPDALAGLQVQSGELQCAERKVRNGWSKAVYFEVLLRVRVGIGVGVGTTN